MSTCCEYRCADRTLFPLILRMDNATRKEYPPGAIAAVEPTKLAQKPTTHRDTPPLICDAVQFVAPMRAYPNQEQPYAQPGKLVTLTARHCGGGVNYETSMASSGSYNPKPTTALLVSWPFTAVRELVSRGAQPRQVGGSMWNLVLE